MKFDLVKYIPRLLASWLSMILIQNVSILDVDNVNFFQMFLGFVIFITCFITISLLCKLVKKIDLDSLVLLLNYFICSLLWLNQNNNILCLITILVFFCIIILYFIDKNKELINNFKINKKMYIFIFLFVIFIPFLVLLTIGVLRYYTYSAPNFDFGIFSHIFYYMKETLIPYSTCERDFLLSHFAVHFSPILYLLLPIYYIISNPVILQISQVILLYLGLIPLIKLCDLYKFSRCKKLVVIFLYSFYPILSSGTFYDFHENCFIPVILLSVFYFFEKDNKIFLYLFILLALLIKEDVFIYIVFFALYIIISRKKVKTGVNILILSLVYFCFTAYFMSIFGQGIMSSRYENLIFDNSGLFGAIKTIIFNPGYTLTQLLTNPNEDFGKLIYFIKMLLPCMFIPFITKKTSRYILLLPILINLLTNYTYAYDVNFHYSYGIMAFVFYLIILNIKDMKFELKRVIILFSLVSTFLFYYSFIIPCFKNNIINYINYKDDYKIVRKVLNTIPKDASVSSSTFYLSHLTNRKELYEVYYHNDLSIIDYVVLDMRYDDNNLEFYLNNNFEIVNEHNGFIIVLKKFNS